MINDSTAPTLGARRLNQYADFGAGGQDAFAAGPERTSVLAILSLICGVICLIPFLGVLGVLLAIGAFFGISSSKGRVGGMGLAIAGLILGLLTTAIWIGITIAGLAALNVMKAGLVRVDSAMTSIEAGDFVAAADTLGTPAQSVSTEDYELFRAIYRERLGAFVSAPTEFGAFFGAFQEVGETMQAQGQQQPNFNSGNGMLPVPAEFERGSALIMYEMPTSGNPTVGPDNFPDAIDVTILLPDGSTLSLFNPDPALLGGASGGLIEEEAPDEPETPDETSDEG